MAELTLAQAGRRPSGNGSTPVEPSDASPGIGPAAQAQENRAAFTREQELIIAWRAEVDDYLLRLRVLGSLPPEEVFATLSVITARMVEIRIQLHRTESRRLTALRTHEIDVVIDECERQFRFHSRIHSCRTFDWEVSGKGQI